MNQAASQPTYRVPPKEMVARVEAPSFPEVSLSPNGEWLLFRERPALWPLSYLARPERRLAGIRFHPATHSLSRQRYDSGLGLLRIADQQAFPVGDLPEDASIGHVLWAPDSRYLAFTLTRDSGMELWVAAAGTGKARCLPDIRLNDTLGAPVSWLADSQSLLCKLVPEDPGTPPEPSAIPDGPMIQESQGEIVPPRNHPDMLHSVHDEALFAYYTTSQIARVTLSGDVHPIGSPGLRAKVIPSPDGTCLFVETVHPPFSHLVPFFRFPLRLEVWNRKGEIVREIGDLPPAEQIPMAFGAVRCGPRHLHWRADAPATLCWVEARDEGDPRQEAEVRDEIFLLDAPFTRAPRRLLALSWRFREIVWGNAHLALVTEHWKRTHEQQTWCLDPSHPEAGARRLWGNGSAERSGSEQRGTPVRRWNAQGRVVLHTTSDGRGFFCVSNSAVSGVNGPGLYRLDPATGEAECMWPGTEAGLETPHEILNARATRLLTWRHAPGEPPNCFLRDRERDERIPLTHFIPSPPRFQEVKRRSLRYCRADGMELAASLHLPSEYDPEDGRLPVVMWAYPREQRTSLPGRWPGADRPTSTVSTVLPVSWPSPLIWLTQGYAVLNGPPMPIVGDGEQAPNDTCVEQLVANAEALVEALDRDGVVDRTRIAVGGHSYGASMVASLLAHTELFCAGIAWSGAYNRTLTPYGFQSEERSLWEAPAVYAALSPFLYVDKIDAPLLLIHGAADENSGTRPLQSVRFFEALRAHGKVARLVVLPHEGHSYQARESVLHVLWEMAEWLERYVKNKP